LTWDRRGIPVAQRLAVLFCSDRDISFSSIHQPFVTVVISKQKLLSPSSGRCKIQGHVPQRKSMRAIKKARRLIEKNPQSPFAQTLSKLILSLESEVQFSLKDIYSLSPDDFELVMDILKDWRLDRYYIGKAKVFDLAGQAIDISESK
jgi:hypothetical protein